MSNLTSHHPSTQAQDPEKNHQKTQSHNLKKHTPTIMIDMKHCRLRIHMRTLHDLGDPKYVQLLINPDSQKLIIRACHSGDMVPQKIKWHMLDNNQCCEIYSKNLIYALADNFIYFNKNHTYRIPGVTFSKEGLVQFDLTKHECIHSNEGVKTNES